MSGFDIRGLVDFKPPQYLCQRCYGLLRDDDFIRAAIEAEKNYPLVVGYATYPEDVAKLPREKIKECESEARKFLWLECPVCGLAYSGHPEQEIEMTPQDKATMLGNYLRSKGLALDFDNLIAHARTLAPAAASLRDGEPPLKVLLSSLAAAQKFVHFVTWGISVEMIGALKLLAQKVPVRGIVSGLEPNRSKWKTNKVSELTKFRAESPLLDVRALVKKESWSDLPHQKLIIIDGLLAFTGSANLTLDAWRKVAQGHDMVDVVTDVERVIELNNRLFSAVWSKQPDLAKWDMVGIEKGRLQTF
jgi:hypothetical protein